MRSLEGTWLPQGEVSLRTTQNLGCEKWDIRTEHRGTSWAQVLSLTPSFYDSQEQLTPSAHHKTSQTPRVVSRRNPQMWLGSEGHVLSRGGGCPGWTSRTPAWVVLTSVSTIPSLPSPGLHSGESHPHGRGWRDPGDPRGAAVSGSTWPVEDSQCIQEVTTVGNNTPFREVQPWGSSDDPGGVKEHLDHAQELPRGGGVVGIGNMCVSL